MSVWLCLPSARPALEANLVLVKWRAQGYKIALWRDEYVNSPLHDDMVAGRYPGYAIAVNQLVKRVLGNDLHCSWVVCGGDDTEPDPNHSADEIALECNAYFVRK